MSLEPAGALRASRLRCEALVDPLAVLEPRPRLSWMVQSERRHQRQTAYEIIASSSPQKLARDQGDLWATLKLPSSQTFDIEYAGRKLEPNQRCYWKVRVWDAEDGVSDWSEAAFFGMGITTQQWQSEWIGFDAARDLEVPPAPFDGASWVWLADHGPSGAFLGELRLPENAVIQDAQIALAVAGRFRLHWGGEHFGMNDDDTEPWRRPLIRRMTERLKPGLNQFFISAEQIDQEPAGLLFKATVRLADEQVFNLVSDQNWRASSQIGSRWQIPTHPDTWAAARVVAPYPAPPWGLLYGAENFLPPPVYLRGRLELPKAVRQATLYATALGCYDLFLNGQRINQSFFDPGWTDYRKRLYYRAFDVTPLLSTGSNALGAVLADGWFSGYIGWYHQRDIYGKHPRFRAQLHVTYSDGSSQVFGTDASWRASLGAYKQADMLMGEVYDARDEPLAWSQAGLNDSSWQMVNLGADLRPSLEPHPAPAVVALQTQSFSPRAITQPQPGVYVLDLGQNFAGVVRLSVRDTTPGQRIGLRHAERLNPDGTLYTLNLRTARATDTYICRGAPEETWSPRFSFHGFQYVEITGLTSPPTSQTITGLPLSTDTPQAGTFECSDQLANQLASNAYWSQRSNYLEIITDCPQRDERLGWCDGAWTFLGAAALRADVQTMYNKWNTDLEDAQLANGQFPWLAPLVVLNPETVGPLWAGSSSAWMDAGIICPWLIYERYGDARQLERHYPAMQRQLEWYINTSRSDLLPPEEFVCLGDWLNHSAPLPFEVFRTVFFAHSAQLMAQSARVLGKHTDAGRYEALFSALKAAFGRAYVTPDGRIKGDVQSAYALAIAFDLLEPEQLKRVGEHLIEQIRAFDWRPSTGLEATLPLMLALAKLGRNDVAYKLLHNPLFPGWNFSIQNGATTIWERWNSWTPEAGFGDANMNSFNHFSLGAVYQWMAQTIGGIQQLETAYKRIRIAPEPGGRVTSAHVTHDCVRGLIETNWRLVDNTLELEVLIPANTTAVVVLPARDGADITESGEPLEHVAGLTLEASERGRVALNVGSGRYFFLVRNPLIAADPALELQR